MKASILLYFTFIFSGLTFAQQWEWVRQIRGGANDSGFAIDVDSEGNVFVAGRCKGLTYFEDETDPIGPITIGDRDAFISKYNKDGQLMWAVQAGAVPDEYDLAQGITSDNAGGCYVTGFFNFTAYFGEDSLISEGGRDVFLTHIDSDGEFTWSKGFGAAGEDNGYGISTDLDGNVLVCGRVNGVVDVEGQTIGTAAQFNAFIGKYTPDGDFIEIHSLEGPYRSVARRIAVDSDNNLYICGGLNGNCTYQGEPLITGNSAAWDDAILMKCNSDFELQWFQSGGGNYFDMALDVDVSNESAYIVGTYASTAVFDTITRTFNSDASGTAAINAAKDLFIASYDKETGDIEWLVDAGSGGLDEAHGVAVSDNENIYFSGYFKDSIAFGDTTLYSGGSASNNILTGRLDTDGNLVWIRETGNDDDNRGLELAIDPFENIYITGDFYEPLSFDGIDRVPVNRDAFGGKMTQRPEPNYSVDGDYCIGDTIIVDLSGLTSPLTFTFTQTDGYTAWTDSTHLYYITEGDEMVLTGMIYAENNIYLDSVELNTPVDIRTVEECGVGVSVEEMVSQVLRYDFENQLILNISDQSINDVVITSLDGKVLVKHTVIEAGASTPTYAIPSGIYLVYSLDDQTVQPIKISISK